MEVCRGDLQVPEAHALRGAQGNASLKTLQNGVCSASFSCELLCVATFATCDQPYIFDCSYISKQD